ncbi:MAG: hypothetical protein ACKVVT_17620 [Dehalococcoidia bacterium]
MKRDARLRPLLVYGFLAIVSAASLTSVACSSGDKEVAPTERAVPAGLVAALGQPGSDQLLLDRAFYPTSLGQLLREADVVALVTVVGDRGREIPPGNTVQTVSGTQEVGYLFVEVEVRELVKGRLDQLRVAPKDIPAFTGIRAAGWWRNGELEASGPQPLLQPGVSYLVFLDAKVTGALIPLGTMTQQVFEGRLYAAGALEFLSTDSTSVTIDPEDTAMALWGVPVEEGVERLRKLAK